MMSLASNIDSSSITPGTQEEADFLIILHVHHTSILESNKVTIRIVNQHRYSHYWGIFINLH